MEQLYRIFILFIPFFGPQIALAYRLDATSQGLKTLDFQGLTPTCPHNGCCPHQKSYARALKDGEIFHLSVLKEVLRRENTGLKVYAVDRSLVFSMTGTYFLLILSLLSGLIF